MAGIRNLLQKEFFDPIDERILSVCNVSKLMKKRSTSYLCIVAASKPKLSLTITQIKQTDKSAYKKKRTWNLEELRILDGKSESTETHEFDMLLEKQYKWFAPNLHERQNFVCVLWRHIIKHYTVGEKPIFKNIPKSWLLDSLSPERTETSKFPANGVDELNESNEFEAYEDFHTLTEKEESDLARLISECNFAVSNAELFMEQLGKNLSDLDGANVQSVLASEKQVDVLMEHIETAIEEAERIEERLDSYDEILCHIRDTMEKMGEKNAMIAVANSNNINLLTELEKVVTQLDLPSVYQVALIDTDLTSTTGLEAAILAGKALQNAMNSDIDPALLRLSAVQDQRKRFEKWKAKFSQTVSRHLNNLFIHLGNDLGDQSPHNPNEITLPKHNVVHKELSAYAELMHWTKSMDRKTYDGLTKVYTGSLSKVYERELRVFFEQARSLLLGNRDEMNTSVSGKLKQQSSKQITQPYGILGINRELWSNGVDLNERQRYDSILERVLAELQPLALSEQMFCIQFFQLDVLSPTTKNTQTTLDGLGSEQVEKSTKDEKDSSFSVVGAQKKITDRQINEEVRRMMSELFGILEPELVNFICSLERLDNFYSMYVLVRLTQHVMSAEDAHSFLSMSFASALIKIKRNFDKFMEMQLQSIREAKLPKRSKCGLLPYVENFEEFAITAENIFKKSSRRTDLDKWYVKLVETIFEFIPQNANDHAKTPHQVVKMENFHHMHSQLARLKLPCLDSLKKDAKIRYNEALRSYVIKYFGRPLDKLNLFFEGVQQKVSQGVKETEISYQMAYSKQELRKVISQYPAREVKKGLEHLYKKVEKHLCDEENLLQVVWRAMQEEFIAQYNFLEERIQRCYAGAMITLDFTIEDILKFFSEIAISH